MNATAIAPLTRTDLTQFEVRQFGNLDRLAKDYSFEIGAFVTRSGQPDVLKRAADVFDFNLAYLVAERDIRTEALAYAHARAVAATHAYGIAQAAQLRFEFLAMLYSAAIAERTA